VISSAGTVPGLGAFNGVHDLPLAVVILVPGLLPERALVRSELHLRAERGEERNENDVGETRVEDAFGEGSDSLLRRGDKVAHDPVLRAVLFDERVVRVRRVFGNRMEGEGMLVIFIGGEAGVGE